MVLGTRMRDSLLQQVAQCLMQLAQSASTSDVVDALEGLLDRLPAKWHTLDVYEEGRRKRLASHRCPKAFESLVARFGIAKRQDGTYQGKFADVTLVMAKAANPSADQFAVCAIGLPKRSPLNDVTATACLGALLQDALSRLFLAEVLSRRAAMLTAFAELTDSSVGVFGQQGAAIESYPAEFPRSLGSALADRLTASSPRSRGETASLPTVVVQDADGSYEGRQKWVRPERVLENQYLVSLAHRRSASTPAVPDHLRKYGLSKREFQVAELVFMGQTNQLIADRLFISRDTVKTHCRRIFGKLGIARRTQILELLGLLGQADKNQSFSDRALPGTND